MEQVKKGIIRLFDGNGFLCHERRYESITHRRDILDSWALAYRSLFLKMYYTIEPFVYVRFRYVDSEDIVNIKKFHSENMTTRQIAKKIGLSHVTIQTVLRERV